MSVLYIIMPELYTRIIVKKIMLRCSYFGVVSGSELNLIGAFERLKTKIENSQ